MSAPKEGAAAGGGHVRIEKFETHVHYPLPGQYDRRLVGATRKRPKSVHGQFPRLARELDRVLVIAIILSCYVVCLGLIASFWLIWDAAF